MTPGPGACYTEAMARTVAATLFALSPLFAGGLALHSLRPAPARTGPDRELILVPGEDAVDAAGAYPGVAALPIGAMGGTLRFDHLPFDALIPAPGVDLDLARFGFAESRTDAADHRWTRARRWSLLDSWATWAPVADHGTGQAPCRHRFEDGGYGCGKGLRFIPDLLATAGEVWAGVRLSAARAGSSGELRVASPPSRLEGWLESLEAGTARLILRRGEAEVQTECEGRCPLVIPPGEGDLTIRVIGPTPAAAFTLIEGPAL